MLIAAINAIPHIALTYQKKLVYPILEPRFRTFSYNSRENV